MNPDRRPLELAFSEPAADPVQAAERPHLPVAERPPFLEPDAGAGPVASVPPPARRPLAQVQLA
ncbi:hypothetical protein [Streptomyces sp. TLI_171]|uniref:hypothetical protein n=1 Tax=Streptomyces sp. TLI_171 TaxID=1938859 RepID=UPI000C19CA8C|nr:hypothetical protein [Streptomyces sp. TLI_171]RKE23628.1 hypothetical protein BX266_7114 [Streptomyces sp. TLI_171]